MVHVMKVLLDFTNDFLQKFAVAVGKALTNERRFTRKVVLRAGYYNRQRAGVMIPLF